MESSERISRRSTIVEAKLNTDKKVSSSCLSKSDGWLQRFDLFGEHFKMKIDEDESILQSTMGSILSIIMMLIIGFIAYQKTDVWLQKKGVDIISATNDSFFDDDFEFSYEDGLNFAMAFTAYDDVTEPILEPEYGKIVFNERSWGYGSEFSIEVK